MIKIEHDIDSLLAKIDGITPMVDAATRPAAQAGAQVFYDEVRQRVPLSAKPHSTKGKKQTYTPGNLRKAVYQAFVTDGDSEKVTYRISWNKSQAFYGRFLEFGTSKMPAKPFLRPAYDAARDRAVAAVKTRLAQELAKAFE